MLINPDKGYNIRNKDGEINLKKFKNALDYSIDSIRLRASYEKATRRKNFSFAMNGKNYTKEVINVNFDYSFKEFNQVYGGLWVKAGYDYRKLELNDNVCVKNGELLAIKCISPKYEPVVEPIDLSNNKYFKYDDTKKCYIQQGEIPLIKDKKSLRNYLYKNGFVCDGIKYVRYKRSSGSSRVGKCLFIDELLASRMKKWDKCGLTINEGDPIDLAAYEAYISLPMSSIIDTIEILPENILVIDDYESQFKDTVISVDTENNKLAAKQKQVTVSNSIWDGESLLDCDKFVQSGYSQYGMMLLRNRFFKSACFNTNIQKWFSDNNITKIEQLNGFTLATDIKEIKLITTPSSIKYLKFGSLKQWLAHIDTTFGIVKHEKPTHFFDGRMVQTHYQLINTLPLTYSETAELLKPSLDYIDSVRTDPDILRFHIKYPYSDMDMDGVNSKNEIIFKLLGINNKFAQTKLYFDFRSDLIKSMTEKLRNGKILVRGNYSTLFGNGIEMLKASIGTFNGSSELVNNEIHSKFFNYGETIVGSRSPHITMGNIALFSNKRNENYEKYFNLSKEIVCINSIGTNILQRLNGSDFDSDTVLLTNNEILVNAAKKIFGKFLVPTNEVKAEKIKRYYTAEQQADLDNKTSVNKIGEIVNLSQQLNSLFWDKYNRGETIEENFDLYCDICKLAVLSNIEIDSAKKEFAVSPTNELRMLKKKYEKQIGIIKPLFFKRITEGNGYKVSSKTIFKEFYTPMDYVQQIISAYNRSKQKRLSRQKPTLSIIDIIKFPNVSQDSLRQNTFYYEKRDRIINLIRETRKTIQNLYYGYKYKSATEKAIIKQQTNEERQICTDYIDNIVQSEAVMYLLLQTISSDEHKDVSRFIFNVLFGRPNIKFFTMIKESKEPMYKLKEDKFGNIQLYDFTYLKEKI